MDENAKKEYEAEFLSDLQDYEAQADADAKAKAIVNRFAVTTSGTGAVPIPFADAPLLVAQQVAMMAAINKIYDIQMGNEALKSLVVAVIGTGGATLAGKTIASNLIKAIPIGGSIVGGAISAGTAGVLTLALGNAYIDVCKQIKGGLLSQGGIKAALKRAFKRELKRSKK